ncbi:MAG: flavin prenyltransferase UbiX [Planctomycetota bacterium]
MATDRPIVLGITGASGAPYAVRLLDVLQRGGHEVHLSISPSGAAVIEQELGVKIDLKEFDPQQLSPERIREQTPWFPAGSQPQTANSGAKLHYHHWQNFMAPIASGSFLAGGTVICPCSGTTLAAVASGIESNLIQRAAEVALKERRKLVLVPRETPISPTYVANMQKATEAGAVVLPAMPGWYHGVSDLGDIVDFVVARICDQLGVDNGLMKRWGAE